jgi:hypothetical protein
MHVRATPVAVVNSQVSHRELSRCYGENYMTEFEKYSTHDKGR